MRSPREDERQKDAAQAELMIYNASHYIVSVVPYGPLGADVIIKMGPLCKG